MPTLGLLHTVRRVVMPLSDLATELLPGVRQLHYLDESVLQDAIAAGGLTPDIHRRVTQLVLLAAERCDVVLVTCSSIGPCAELAARLTHTPVLRIDRPMAEEAVSLGTNIAVIATLGTTLGPTADIIERAATDAGRIVTVRRHLCEGAFAAGSSGNQAEHDRLVLEGLQTLLTGPDAAEVIVLAQASMASIAAQLGEVTTPILSSPRSGLIRAGEVLRALGAT
ncbi:MAG: aspartate/glutamate racemase family protein [Armatimonadia bacterium]